MDINTLLNYYSWRSNRDLLCSLRCHIECGIQVQLSRILQQKSHLKFPLIICINVSLFGVLLFGLLKVIPDVPCVYLSLREHSPDESVYCR